MKSVIDGKIYDTDTAERLTISQGRFPDYELGKTPRGNYFTMIKGSPCRAVTEKDARALVELSMRAFGDITIAEYEAFFGRAEEA